MTEDSTVARLDDFLKLVGVVGTGGEAKILIQSGQVLVNGEIETRRRRQLKSTDTVLCSSQDFRVGEHLGAEKDA